MALVDFPSTIQVVLGSAWNPNEYLGLSQNDVVTLYEYTSGVYTEDGTNVPHASHNRLKVNFRSIGNSYLVASLSVPTISVNYWFGSGWWQLQKSDTNTETPTTIFNDYTFQELWNMWGGTVGYPYSSVSAQYAFVSTSINYNPEVFSSISAGPSFQTLACTINGESNLNIGALAKTISLPCLINSSSDLSVAIDTTKKIASLIESQTTVATLLNPYTALLAYISCETTLNSDFIKSVMLIVENINSISSMSLSDMSICIDMLPYTIDGVTNIISSIVADIGMIFDVCSVSTIYPSIDINKTLISEIVASTILTSSITNSIDLSSVTIDAVSTTSLLSPFIILINLDPEQIDSVTSIVPCVIADFEFAVNINVESTCSPVIPEDCYDECILFIHGHEDAASGVPLYVRGINYYNDDITLFIKSDTPSLTNNIPLYIQESTASYTNRFKLFIKGYGTTPGAFPCRNNMTLYIGSDGDAYGSGIPMYVGGLTDINTNIPLYMQGAIPVYSGIPLSMPNVLGDFTSSIKLYTHGF